MKGEVCLPHPDALERRRAPELRVGLTRSPFGPRGNRDATAVERPRRRPRQSCRGSSNPLQRRASAIQLRPSAHRSGRQVVGEEYTLEIVRQWGESARLRITSVHGMKYKHWPENPRLHAQCVCLALYSPVARKRYTAFHRRGFHGEWHSAQTREVDLPEAHIRLSFSAAYTHPITSERGTRARSTTSTRGLSDCAAK